MEGYRLMANAFLKQYNASFTSVSNGVPAPNPLRLKKLLKDKQKI